MNDFEDIETTVQFQEESFSTARRLNVLARGLRHPSSCLLSNKPMGSTADRGPLTTHVLDTSIGTPAQGLRIELFDASAIPPRPLVAKTTGPDGRLDRIVQESYIAAGTYMLRFHTKEYFQLQNKKCLYPHCDITFQIDSTDSSQHFHVPLILSPYGYSTYRGS